jgi:hypothetical protein
MMQNKKPKSSRGLLATAIQQTKIPERSDRRTLQNSRSLMQDKKPKNPRGLLARAPKTVFSFEKLRLLTKYAVGQTTE